ncbi:MTH1187 family thiamine-binding protein [Alteribacter natronophilus]|uniref:MTH1187 family thiamine-binding protein n=1 Tax=Alteribacter natronophilus TaxID=2583810 RepID=UPI00148754C1|nr:MTH1187 family thiamine-binding protein [Alteribacter natronophilus]
MVTADVSIIPVGKNTTSESDQIAEIEKVLKEYEGKLTYKVHAMSTVIDAELPVLFEVLEKVHELPFKQGVDRVSTSIRIDDRRDRQQSMEDKEESVKEKVNR